MPVNNPTFDIEVVPAVRLYILDHKATLDQALSVIGQQLKAVFPYEKENIDVDMYPCITLGNPSFQKSWVAAPYEIEVRYELPINGYVLYDDNDDNALAIRGFAAALSYIFEDFHGQELTVPDKEYKIHYHSEVPLDSMEVDYALIGDAFLRSFNATWHGYITRNLEFWER